MRDTPNIDRPIQCILRFFFHQYRGEEALMAGDDPDLAQPGKVQQAMRCKQRSALHLHLNNAIDAVHFKEFSMPAHLSTATREAFYLPCSRLAPAAESTQLVRSIR